jgi:hypothetical protein
MRSMPSTQLWRKDVFKYRLIENAQLSKAYGFPIIQRSEETPQKATAFHRIPLSGTEGQWLHFYTDDYRFECVWSNATRYLPMLKRCAGVITPDFSLYRTMPLAMQIWNTYRNRTLAHWLQANGVPIVPNVRWGDERTYAFAFEGLPLHSSLAVSTHGCIHSKADRYYFRRGLAQMVLRLEPTAIISYSQTPGDIFGEYARKGIPIIPIEHPYIAAKRMAP